MVFPCVRTFFWRVGVLLCFYVGYATFFHDPTHSAINPSLPPVHLSPSSPHRIHTPLRGAHLSYSSLLPFALVCLCTCPLHTHTQVHLSCIGQQTTNKQETPCAPKQMRLDHIILGALLSPPPHTKSVRCAVRVSKSDVSYLIATHTIRINISSHGVTSISFWTISAISVQVHMPSPLNTLGIRTSAQSPSSC
ncbi:hypothetical protein K457DRAFT_593046 [Linnemannia elongata AG-77]|uniref:Uncharacterized protein n=1 Tax=Linnemannia elongata AG-77 TaxID=1314771 RepID=A0A197JSY2_9FUNG|nr:hypothetical protein K457DRAFT_593046 [Linnemannia elongata AG-77]